MVVVTPAGDMEVDDSLPTPQELPARLEAALQMALESLGGTGAEELLALLVDSIGLLSQSTADAVAASKQAAEAARESAESAARDSAAAAIAMSECSKSAVAAAQSAESSAARAAAQPPNEAASPSLSTSRLPPASADAANGRTVQAPPPPPPPIAAGPIAEAGGLGHELEMLGMEEDDDGNAEAAEQMAELLESAQKIASELVAMLDDPDVNPDPEAGAEQLRRGVAANQQEDFAAATAWFEESHRRRPRVSTLLSVANMRLKLGDGPLAAHLYSAILEHPSATVRPAPSAAHACARAAALSLALSLALPLPLSLPLRPDPHTRVPPSSPVGAGG